jgi:hypothetical protein
MSINTSNNTFIRLVTNTKDVTLTFLPQAVTQTVQLLNYQKLTSDIKTYMSSKGRTAGRNLNLVNNSTLSSTTINSGTSNEKQETKISAIVPFNKFVKIGNLIITAKSNKKLTNKPSLILNQSLVGTDLEKFQILELRPAGTTLTDGFITTRSYNLFYKATRAISAKDNVSYTLNISAENKVVKALQIKDVLVLDRLRNVHQSGETKKLRIVGTPGTNFKFTIFDDNDKCLLAYDKFNTTITTRTGSVIKAYESKLPKVGFYDCDVLFPSAPRVLTTAVDVGGGVTNATQVTFDSLTGVSVGDNLIAGFVQPFKSVKVISIDSSRTCTLSRPVTASDDAVVSFTTNANYNFLIESTDSLGSNIPTTNPNYIYTQSVTPVLISKSSTATTNFTINGGANGVDHEAYYEGIAGATSEYIANRSNYVNRFKINLSLVRASATSKTFSLIKQPVFSQDDQVSDFTNTNPSLNGGTELTITKPKVTISSDTQSCTITAVVNILKWGTSDLTVELDLDQIVSCT